MIQASSKSPTYAHMRLLGNILDLNHKSSGSYDKTNGPKEVVAALLFLEGLEAVSVVWA